MNRKISLFMKIFLPLLAVVAAAHICIFYALGPKSDTAAAADTGIPNADLSKLPPPESAQQLPVSGAVPIADSRRTAAKTVLPGYDFSNLKKLPASLQKSSRICKSGIIIDLSSRQVIWAKNPTRPVPIASLTKIMTALLVMEDIDSGRLSMNIKLPVTNAATDVERSCVLGMKRGEYYTIEELIAAAMINSHNDAAAQLAASVSGNVSDFVKRMNQRAYELGLHSAKFNSPNGLPQGRKRLNSYCSVYDITRICEHLRNYPDLMKFCNMRSKKLHTGKVVYSHNHLLGIRRNRKPVAGIYGFKTGYTNKAGFCLAFGVQRNGKNIIGCVAGFPSAADRDNFCRSLIEWAYSTKR